MNSKAYMKNVLKELVNIDKAFAIHSTQLNEALKRISPLAQKASIEPEELAAFLVVMHRLK